MVGMVETRERLMDLGETAVRKRGYGAFSYGDLAKDAGIRKASIHHHFPTKADLGLALIQRYSANLDTLLDDIIASSNSGGQALSRIIMVYRNALGEGDSLCLCCSMAGDSALLTREMSAALDQANQNVIVRILDTLDMGNQDGSISKVTRTEGFGTATLATLQGAQLLARAAGEVSRFDMSVSTLRTTILSD